MKFWDWNSRKALPELLLLEAGEGKVLSSDSKYALVASGVNEEGSSERPLQIRIWDVRARTLLYRWRDKTGYE